MASDAVEAGRNSPARTQHQKYVCSHWMSRNSAHSTQLRYTGREAAEGEGNVKFAF